MAAVSEQTARVAPVQLSGQLIQVDCCPAAFLPGQGAELQVQEEVHPLPSISSVSLSLLPFFLLCSTIQCALSSCWTVRKKSKIGSNFFFPKNSNWKIRIPPRFIQQCAKLPDDNKFSDEILGWKNVNNFCHFFRGADRWDRWAKIHEIRYEEEEEEGGGTKMSA